MNRKSWLGSKTRPSNAQPLHPAKDAQTPQSILPYTRTKTTATAEKLLPFTLPFSCRIKILFTRIKDTFLKRGYYARRMQLVHLLLIHTVIFVDKLSHK